MEIKEIKTPEELMVYFNDFNHDYLNADLKNLDLHELIYQYFGNNRIPVSAFLSFENFVKNKKGSCYDFSVFSRYILYNLGYQSDVLHFLWTPDNTSKSFAFLPDIIRERLHHSVCRFVVDNLWYVVNGFLYGANIEIVGPFSSLNDFVLEFNKKIKKNINSDIISVDSWSFDENYFPSGITKLYPIEETEKRFMGYY